MMIKKTATRLLLAIFSLVALVPRLVFAESYDLSKFEPSGYKPQTEAGTVGSSVFTLVIVVSAILVLAYLLWGAINIITAGGDKTKVAAARDRMVFAVIGLIMIASVWAIFNLIVTITLGSPESISVPTISGS